MRTNKASLFFASVVVVVAAFTTTACSVTTSGDEPRADGEETETTATTSSALNNSGHGGGGTALYGCSGLLCTCTGDVDCNDMFTNAGCGDVSKCDESGPEPVCWCLRGISHSVPKGDAGVKVSRAGAKLSP